VRGNRGCCHNILHSDIFVFDICHFKSNQAGHIQFSVSTPIIIQLYSSMSFYLFQLYQYWITLHLVSLSIYCNLPSFVDIHFSLPIASIKYLPQSPLQSLVSISELWATSSHWVQLLCTVTFNNHSSRIFLVSLNPKSMLYLVWCDFPFFTEYNHMFNCITKMKYGIWETTDVSESNICIIW